MHSWSGRSLVWLAAPVPLFVGATLVLLLWPCQSGLFVVGCDLGRAVSVAMAALLLTGYVILALLTSLGMPRASAGWRRWPLILGGLGLLVAGGECLWLLAQGRDEPGLAPSHWQALRAEGERRVTFGPAQVVMIEANDGVSLEGFEVTLTVTVAETGTFAVHAPRFIGEANLPLSAYSLDTGQPVSSQRLTLTAAEPTSFSYRVHPPGGAPPVLDPACQWRILWVIEDHPPYPLYLLGGGLYAAVSDRARDDVTHTDATYAIGPLACARLN
jgi:hypothetical protein